MKTNLIAPKDLLYIVPSSLLFGAWMGYIERGSWGIGFASFSFIFLVAFILLKMSHAWSNGGRTLGVIITLAFFLRLLIGVEIYQALPIYGHSDADDRAGYVFTDAHTRDIQAWYLATSDHSVLEAFSKKYSSDQYGGLLAFNALAYRYLSPDVRRPLMLILFSAFIAALGVPFFWKAAFLAFGERVAWVSTWIFALYPESILLGTANMREPYILTFSAFAFWGFVSFMQEPAPTSNKNNSYAWLGLGLAGLMLVSAPAALVTMILLAGWYYFANEKRQISWKAIVIIAVVLALASVVLSLSLNRSGQFNANSPLRVINGWMKSAVNLSAYNAEGDSGWVQRILGDQYGETVYRPVWYRLPFLAGYGVLQPVLPAALIYPTKLIWQIIGILRGLGWYALLPMLILPFVAAAGQRSVKMRNVILWLSLLTWTWILVAALRGGADLWDNPRYRIILFVWQAVLAGYVWVWWRETRNAWFVRVWACEIVFVLIFTQWYASRYLNFGFQLPFAVMVGLILGLWGAILGIGWWHDKQRA